MNLRSPAAMLSLLLFAPSKEPSPDPRLPPLVPADAAIERVRPNDNRRAAGTLRDGVLTLRLEARPAMWHPDGDDAPGAEVPAFAEAGREPEIPGPLIRVPAGTEVAVTVRNSMPNDTLTVSGLETRPVAGVAVDPLQVPPGTTREARFRLDAPGTYYYWGTTMGRSFLGRTREDARLSGAIIVDEPGRPVPPDRVLMIGMWADTLDSENTQRPNRRLFVVNGRSWPHTERLSYSVGDTVRWRLLNVSADVHPMHLHGFYFRVDSRGDMSRDSALAEADRDLVVTHLLRRGQTIRTTWIPERAGNWLFHCHIPEHFGPRGSLGTRRADPSVRPLAVQPSGHPAALPSSRPAALNHALEGMNGLVVGVTVTLRAGEAPASTANEGERRRLRLLVRENAGGSASAPYYAFTLHETGPEPPADSGHRAGPPIVLTRGEPVSITVVNQSPEPTAVHWHGIELESYFDGVAGFSGSEGRLAPVIAPRDSFEARFTPPRAGTFIYHTHVNELRQQRAGLAGPLIVLEPGQRYDPATDFVVLITSPSDSADATRAVLLDGSLTPPPVELRAGVAHRLRFINITVGRPGMRMELRRDSTLLEWRVLAKDGADLPTTRKAVGPARQPISIGETVDVEVTPSAPGEMRLEARTAGGALLGVIPLRIRSGG